MNELDSIIKAMAAKNHSSLMAESKPAPAPAQPAKAAARYSPRTYTTGPSLPRNGRVYDEGVPPKVFPSERMGLINATRDRPIPKREAFNMFSFSDEDLDFAFSIKVKRGWDFPQWLEVIGFPPDLHPKLDGATYSYAEKAFLKLKQEAHRQ